LFKGSVPFSIESAVFVDRATKYAYARELAAQVAASGADGLITLGEVWQSGLVLDEEGVATPPAEVPDRREALQVYAEVKSGEYKSKVCFFHRRFGRIQLDEEVNMEIHSLENNFMLPVRESWKTEKPGFQN
jgi:hypothetical protein